MTTQPTPHKHHPLPIITTGDVIMDRQIYQGDRLVPSQQGKVAPHFSETSGGAALLHAIIAAAVGENHAAFGLTGPSVQAVCGKLAVQTLWKPCPGGLLDECAKTAPASKPKRVWRVAEPLGYALDSGQQPALSKSSAADAAHSVLVIDDADLGFRTHFNRAAWPLCIAPGHQTQPAWIILKMSNPLAQGDLWRSLTARPAGGGHQPRKNLIVVTSADELRHAGAAISRGLSWEATLADLCKELDDHPCFSPLLRHARHLIINFGCVGTVWFDHATSKAGTPPDKAQHRARLIYDPTLAEGGWKSLLTDGNSKEDHKVYGHLNTFTAALAVHIHQACAPNHGPLNFDDAIKTGLTAVRQLRLLGHGPVAGPPPQYPFKEIADLINPPAAEEARTNAKAVARLLAPHGYQAITAGDLEPGRDWTFAALSENPPDQQRLPLYGLAHRVAMLGRAALNHIPHAQFGAMLSVDRAEIETLRSLSKMILAYETGGRQKQPLCLAAFGPPGAGKSFGIKQIARKTMGGNVPILEFNLSQYNDPADLIGAFHQVRDKCLQGLTPVVFWDEFDAGDCMWLQYLLAPMQDGSFQENGHIHTLGKCIFVFAGATSWDFEHFGPAPMPPDDDKDAAAALKARYKANSTLKKAEDDANAAFRRKKGPDFLSRLDGHINVLGPNPRLIYDWKTRLWETPDRTDITFPVRRAVLLRNFLGAEKDDAALNIDRDLLRAFLHVPRYRYGARSLEKIARPLLGTHQPFCRSNLPPPQVLHQHLDTTAAFDAIHEQNREFLIEDNVRTIAAAVADYYDRAYGLVSAKRTTAEAKAAFETTATSADPWQQWHAATNIAAARRLPDILALVGLRLEKGAFPPAAQHKVSAHLARHLSVLAEEEHNLWSAFHLINGWHQASQDQINGLMTLKDSDTKAFDSEIDRLKRELRIHTLLVPFDKLPDPEKAKDHNSITNYPSIVTLVGWKIVFVDASVASGKFPPTKPRTTNL